MVNVPNTITAFRAFLIPPFIIAVLYRDFKAAAVVFFAAAVSDAVDGFVARRLKQVTTVGVILDPIVDKLLINSAFVMLSYVDKIIPIWLTIIVLSRDVLILVGGWLLTVFGKVKRIKPNILGKLTAFFQFLTVFLTLLKLNLGFPQYLLEILYVTTGIFTVASAVGYTLKGISELSNEEIL